MVSTAGHLFNCVSITYIEKESYWHNVSLVWEHKKQNKNINIILLFNKGSNQKGFYTCWPSSPHISDISQVLTVLTECRHPLPVIQHIILSPSTSLSTYSFVSSPFILILPFPVTCSHHSLFFYPPPSQSPPNPPHPSPSFLFLPLPHCFSSSLYPNLCLPHGYLF